MLKIENIVKSYGPLKVLDNLSLDIVKNEVVSLIGHSGCGKSTLLNCIAGLEEYESGNITINNERNDGYNGVGMVFQRGNLFPHLNVIENLTLAPINVLGTSKEEAEKEAEQILDKVGLWGRRFEYPESLSSGQRQRVAIARCLMMHPDVILLDEPISSLDPISADEVVKVLSSLKKQEITMVIVSHKINFVRSISDRIVFIHDGVAYEQGTPAEIIDNPKLNETKLFINHSINLVYDIQSAKYDHPELNARIEDFCLKYRLTSSDTFSTQLVVEELLNLLPLDEGLRLIISKSGDPLEVEVIMNDKSISYLSADKIKNDLSYRILDSMCSSIIEQVNESGQRNIKLIIRKNQFKN